MIETWSLDDDHQTLVLAATDRRLPQIVYWGPPLPGEDIALVARSAERDVTGGMLDANPDLCLCPEAAVTFPGQPGLIARDAATGRRCSPRFRLVEVVAEAGTLSVTARDDDTGLTYGAEIALDAATGMLMARATLLADAPILLDWLAAPVFPASDQSDQMIDFVGRWCGEFAPNRVPWSHGIRLRESRTGRTGHEHLPLLYVPEIGATNTAGNVTAFHYGWSGGHRMVAEELPDGRRQIQFGHAAGSIREPGTRFETATLYACRSDTGLNGCATAFQRHLRDRIVTWPRPEAPRPVHYNCWEAVYFDHRLADLKDIATQAAALGAERFVLDDGWFGLRDADNAALGDWTVDARKYPDGLAPLIDHVHEQGMTFGLWVEPEMISPDSDLFRAHPDWALGRADQTLGRAQMVLDLSRSDVREHLFEWLSALLSDHAIDYLKWDHNRVLPVVDSRQTEGLYDLLGRLRAAFPAVEIESCASGGGRIDFGIMAHCARVWPSDSNDALERMRIQHDAALLLPMAVTGSHVGPRRCHTSGREIAIETRAWVAAQRHMGFEMDPRDLTDAEAAALTDVTAWWKANRDWMTVADILRLDSSDTAVIAEAQVAADRARFVVFAAQVRTSEQIAPRPLRLDGLDPSARYRVTLRNRDSATHLSRGTPVLKEGPLTLSGQYLMTHGLTLPWSFPERVWVVEGERT